MQRAGHDILRAVRRSFTLAEILVSVAVLIAILIVAGRVFSTAQQVSNVGSASADVLQEAAAIERQIREDVERMSPQGVVAIRSTSVRNDQRLRDWDGTGLRPGLINPNMAADVRVRCDQLVFFTDGISRLKQMGGDGYNTAPIGGDWFPKLLAEGSMIYYGHALQFPELDPCYVNPDPDHDTPVELLHGHDVDFVELRESEREITPWFDGGSTASVPTIHREYPRAATDDAYDHHTTLFPEHSTDDILGTQPEARKWVLARQETVLGDDDQQLPGPPPSGSNYSKRIYMSRGYGAMSIFPVDPRWAGSFGNIHFKTIGLLESGRVDLAGMRFAGLREALTVSRTMSNPNNGLPANRSWDQVDVSGSLNRDVLDGGGLLPGDATQRDLIKSLVRWPRAERVPPGEGRFDQHLSIPVLGSACSSFIVEWTWDEGVGEIDTVETNIAGNGAQTKMPVTWVGLEINPDDSWDGSGGEAYPDQRWFGLYDKGRSVMPFSDLGAVADELQWQGFAECFPPDPDNYTHAPATVRAGVVSSSNQGSVIDPAFLLSSIEEASYPTGFGGNEDQRPQEYWALFGLNNDSPLVEIDELDNLTGALTGGDCNFAQGDGLLDFDYAYTPWPSALRFTMVLHDPDTRLENGQVVQFVVRLPERCQP